MHFIQFSLAVAATCFSFASALPASNETAHIFARANGSPRLIAYVQTFHTPEGQPLSLLPLVQQKTRITHINLAAVHINGPGQITLNDNSPDDAVFNQVWSDAAQLQQAGVKVLFMLGGAAQGSYGRLCGANNGNAVDDTMYNPLAAVIRRHKIDGVDLDIEESVTQNCALALLNRFYSDFGPSFILTMAPVASAMNPNGAGLSGFDYVSMDRLANANNKANGKLVDWYNAQFYNGWGDARTTSNYENIVRSGGWSPSRVALGVLDNPNDGGSGYVALGTLEQVVVSLKRDYGNAFGGVVGWEYWDSGRSEGISQPSQWVQRVGDALFDGKVDDAAVSSNALNSTSLVPWPAEHQALVDDGMSFMEAVKALNVTDGNMDLAKQIFNVTGLLEEIF